MKNIICAHSIYENSPTRILDDISCEEFSILIKKFDISFDDGYRSVYTLGKELFRDINNKVYIFINPEFIENSTTVWWFEIYDFINENCSLSFYIIQPV